MKFTIHLLLLSSLLLSSMLAHAAESTDTDAYIAALTHLLEQKTIGDAELVIILEAADDGKVVNPILPIRAETSVEHFVANEALQEMLDGKIDAAQVAAWAEANIKEQDRVRKKRKQTQDDTEVLWEDIPSVLSASDDHSCAVNFDGTVKCWGQNDLEQANPPSGVFKSVSAGSGHACGVKLDGTVKCWGKARAPASLGLVLPGRAPDPCDLFLSVSTGGRHTCGVKVDRSIKCWGANDWGQSAAPSGSFQSVSAGLVHTCGVRTNGKVECWGQNGKLDWPPGVFQSVSVGAFYSCGVRLNGTVECWGKNSHGQSSAPQGVFRSVSASQFHTCGVKIDGSVSCWGAASNWPMEPAGQFHSVSVGRKHTCGVRLDGAIKCLGNNDYNQLTAPHGLMVSTGQINEVQNQYYNDALYFIQRARCIWSGLWH